MRFDEWWNNYTSEGGKTHFYIFAHEESARAAWGAIEAERDRYRKALEHISDCIPDADTLGVAVNIANEALKDA